MHGASTKVFLQGAILTKKASCFQQFPSKISNIDHKKIFVPNKNIFPQFVLFDREALDRKNKK